MKVCKVCGTTKPLSDFYAMVGMRDGHRNECKACNLSAKRSRYANDPERYKAMVKRWQQANADRVNAYQRDRRQLPEVRRRQRDGYYRRTYGLSADEVDALLDLQGGGCAICGDQPERLASMHVDHDHDTGEVRGVLCLSCNQGLGKFRDDPELLGLAADYLRRRGQASLAA